MSVESSARSTRFELYASTLVAALGVTQAVGAQTAPESEELQVVVVTGSRIVEPGLKSISPVTSVGADEIKMQGVTRVEDLLNDLPQVVSSQGSATTAANASGAAMVDLRGLGAQRTLVLINGRRLMPGTPSNTPQYAAADLNNIPSTLVKRVDVLTGGASAVYGADATAGVVNFIMDDDFEGVRVDASLDFYSHHQGNSLGHFAPNAGFGSAPASTNDGKNKDFTVALGGKFAEGKGSAVAYLGYRETDGILQGDRDFGRCTLQSSNAGVISCGGSSTAATGRFFATNFLASPNQSVPAFFPAPYLTVRGGQMVPWQSSDTFNYSTASYYQRPDERRTGGAFVRYDLNDNHQVYSELMFMSDRTQAQNAPSGLFLGAGLGTNPFTGNPAGTWAVNCDNPFLSAQQRSTLCNGLPANGTAQVLFGRRNVEGGNAVADLERTSYRFVIGSRGDLNDVFSYDVYAQEGTTNLTEHLINDTSKFRMFNALQVVQGPNGPICAANANGRNGAPGCVPYNIWGTGAVDPLAVSYITVPAMLRGSTQERVVSGNITGNLGEYGIMVPSATTGVIVNVGVEYRQEAETLEPDIEFRTADLAAQGSATLPLDASYHVWEGFFETRVPIAQGMRGLDELSFEAGYRRSDYTVGYTTDTYKFGIDWAPVADLRLRASYNRAARAPNLQELYAERFLSLGGSTDPCSTSSGARAAATLAQCMRSGMSAAQYGTIGTPGNQAGQYNSQLGGNPDLTPEIADTYTFGAVLSPAALPNFDLTVDYFDIKIKDVISAFGANLIVNQCVLRGNADFCNSTRQGQFVGVHRDDAGSIWFSPNGYVGNPLLNLGYLRTRGIDVSSHYRQDIGGAGELAFSLTGTYTTDRITEPYPGSGSYNCAGYFGATCGNPLPKWRHALSTVWTTPLEGLSVMARWRHLDSVELELTNSSPLLQQPGIDPRSWQSFAEIGARDYLDLVFAYATEKGITLRLGVNNAFDKDPPVLPGTAGAYSLPPPYFHGNTYPQVYDTLGRSVFLSLSANFN